MHILLVLAALHTMVQCQNRWSLWDERLFHRPGYILNPKYPDASHLEEELPRGDKTSSSGYNRQTALPGLPNVCTCFSSFKNWPLGLLFPCRCHAAAVYGQNAAVRRAVDCPLDHVRRGHGGGGALPDRRNGPGP